MVWHYGDLQYLENAPWYAAKDFCNQEHLDVLSKERNEHETNNGEQS